MKRNNLNMFEMYVEATVRGYHAHLYDTSVRIGEILTCELELDNPHNRYAVAVKLGWPCTKGIIEALP